MRIKRNTVRFGRQAWDGTERWPGWRKMVKREATRRDRREGKKFIAEG